MGLLGKVLPTVHDGVVAHNYVALMPEVSESTEEWLKKYAPPAKH